MKKTGYEGYSIDRMFRCYQFENDRINKCDAALTKSLIRKELHQRVEKALAILDAMDDSGDEALRVNRFYLNQFLPGRM